jgi:hypothetical protein
MNLRRFLTLFPALAALAPLGVAATVGFGRFGATLEEAKGTHFFTWFHLEQTALGVCFQPSGEKFHDLVKLTVNTLPNGEIRAMTLAVKRSFIDGRDSIFARDIAKSFLEAAVHGDGLENRDVTELINEIWNSPRDGRTPAYGVFLGQGPEWSEQVALQKLTLENRMESGEGWLIMRVERIAPR